VGAPSRAKVNRPAPHDCAVGGVLDADHVRPGDDSIDVVDLVGENRLDVGRALDVGCIVGQRAAYHANRNGKCSVGMLDTVGRRRVTQQNVRSDRPADRSDKRQAASPVVWL
jgi:hypothetical protein